jgi:uncharacterized protein
MARRDSNLWQKSSCQNNDDVDFITQYLNENVLNEEQALQGARDIIAEWINENIYVRKQLRRLYLRKASTTKVVKSKKRKKMHKI